MAKTIITIGRQFGSNGRNIGRKLAEKISANFYDKELINETAKESGLSEEFLKSLDEKPTRSFQYSLVADKGPSVFVGRCADYALRHNTNLVRIFIHAPLEERIKNVSERFNLTPDKAKAQIVKEDKARASYYNYYTSKKWGALESYDIFINSSLMSEDDTVDFIIDYIDKIK